jgi:hypothetical protein
MAAINRVLLVCLLLFVPLAVMATRPRMQLRAVGRAPPPPSRSAG